ncbi:PREDICTED: uncharacterized protein LOC109179616 [Ipomoea nil]|uniref:uncharacterized protein LOC109179616 n=1 Tax=Ipomoea nil TaxID=35883 RepID=UPI000901EDA5|nr:PREDICTED: uncharacterized protein LOC109179616 [Ipomoea nil]
MAKAYDRMEWSFVSDMLVGLGFDAKWIQLIMLCIQTVRYKVLVNGRPTEEIVPTRGLRQGDPLSPYLFIICAEGLSLLLQDSQSKWLIHGCRVARGAPPISHLFFADDSLLFFKANLQEAMEVKRCLGVYESYSGQAVNFHKSNISFSRNTHTEMQDLVSGVLIVSQAENFGKYLGLPSVVGRNRRAVFAYIEQKLKQRFSSWNKRLLTKAGKEVLLKSVAQAMPTYTMSIYLLPITLCASLERLMNRYWWGNGGNAAKQGWRLLTNPTSLMTRVFKARHFPTSSFYEAVIGGNPSYVWKSIMAGQDLLKSGCRRRIGDGTATRVWTVPWLPDRHNPYVESDQAMNGHSMLVSELIDAHTGTWNLDLLQQNFNARDTQLILRVPVSTDFEDWEGDIRGCYSVKDGYRRLGFLNTDPSPVWNNIWKLQVPPKWKVFLWRALLNILPTLDNLIVRRVELQIPPCANRNFYQWTEEWLGSAPGYTKEVQGRMCGVLHAIWTARNTAVWDSVVPRPASLLMRLAVQWTVWMSSQQPHVIYNSSRNVALHAQHSTTPASFKCYVDAGFHGPLHAAAYGFVVFDSDSSFVAAGNGPLPCPYDPLLAEAMAMCEALSWLKNNGYSGGYIYSDSAVLVTSLSFASSFRNYFRFILLSCTRLLSELPGSQVKFVRREANHVAHFLSKHVSAIAGRTL